MFLKEVSLSRPHLLNLSWPGNVDPASETHSNQLLLLREAVTVHQLPPSLAMHVTCSNEC